MGSLTARLKKNSAPPVISKRTLVNLTLSLSDVTRNLYGPSILMVVIWNQISIDKRRHCQRLRMPDCINEGWWCMPYRERSHSRVSSFQSVSLKASVDPSGKASIMFETRRQGIGSCRVHLNTGMNFERRRTWLRPIDNCHNGNRSFSRYQLSDIEHGFILVRRSYSASSVPPCTISKTDDPTEISVLIRPRITTIFDRPTRKRQDANRGIFPDWR